ncbi:MAG: YncE family protein [Deferrisomatales bacterium]
MRRRLAAGLLGGLLQAALPCLAAAEILALVNYETKPEQAARREGLAILDVDPASDAFGRVLVEIPLPPDLVAHHLYYHPDRSRLYVTALGRSELRVLDLARFPYRMKVVEVPGCRAGEDLAFSASADTWYLTCMGSSRVVVGDARLDRPRAAIDLPAPYPHGIALHEGIDRLLVTSTVRPTDLGEPGDSVTVLEARAGRVLSTHRVPPGPAPTGSAPVEVMFHPTADPPVAYLTTLYGGGLWTAAWDPAIRAFDLRLAFDLAALGFEMPLEVYFSADGGKLFVTTARPGNLHVFDLGRGVRTPILLRTVPTAAGAHHVAFTPDGRLAFVQNSLLNLPGLSDGSITVVDLARGEAVARVDTLKNQGLNPNCIVLLPDWLPPGPGAR